MSDVKQMFGIKPPSGTSFSSSDRKSIEQTEDYAVKKVVHTQELYVSKMYLNQDSDTYFFYNDVSHLLELYVNGVKVAEW